MIKINSMEDLAKHELPLNVLKDIHKRITDWLSRGGNIEDDYIKQQFRYAENILNRRKVYNKLKGENKMLEKCYDCNSDLNKDIEDTFGYWGDVEIKFINLPRYECLDCKYIYLEPYIAILTQEITKALVHINKIDKPVDISQNYEELTNYIDEIYDLIINGGIQIIDTNNTIIIKQ